MTDETRDIGRAIGRIFDELQALQRRNNPDSNPAVAESASEELALDDTTVTTAKSGSDRLLEYDSDTYGFGEYD